MKKGISIFLSLMMVVAVLHISVAMHYCEGKEVATMVSLADKLASCGMTCSEEQIPARGTSFARHCCDNTVTFCGTSSNYSPTYFYLPEIFQNNFQIFAIPVTLSFNPYIDLIPLYTNVSPPDELMSTNVDLSDICVYRI